MYYYKHSPVLLGAEVAEYRPLLLPLPVEPLAISAFQLSILNVSSLCFSSSCFLKRGGSLHFLFALEGGELDLCAAFFFSYITIYEHETSAM